MFTRARHFLHRHPLVRDALLWAIPAVIFGALIRVLLLSYLPYAYWGADSKSYFGFAHKLLTEGYISLNEKRRFLYPMFLVPVSMLPGAPLRWLAVIQHLIGLGSLVPLAYIVRKTLVHWRLWIVPVTVTFSGLPVIVWYEHELLGENIFFATLLWAFAGWCAWVGEVRRERALRLFWWFFVPFTLFILTKPSGRFVWPGIIVGMVLVAAWRRLDRRRIVALGALAIATLFVGSKKQGAWLFYTAVFPLTQLDTPLHAEYKAQIRDLVESMRARLDNYYTNDTDAFEFLERTDSDPNRPLWVALDHDEKKKSKVFMDLAIEAVKANPIQFGWLSVQRAIASANVSDFDSKRFTSEYHRERVGDYYTEAETKEKDQVRFAFGLPGKGPIEPFAEFDDQLVPAPNSWRERTVISTVYGIASALDFYEIPKLPRSRRYIRVMEPKPLAWWLLAATVLSMLPRYRRTLGIWMIVAVGYEFGVFLVSQHNARYFAPIWPMIIILFAVPADVLVQMIRRLFASPVVCHVSSHFRNSLLLAVWSLALFAAGVLIDTRHHGFPYFYHPDEPGKVGQIISGDWNLHHPMLLLQTTKLFVEMIDVPRAEQPVVEAGRVVSAIFCAGAVVALSLLAYAWRGWGAALAAGGVLAWHHQLFELAHYLKEDSALLFGMSVAFLAAWLFAQRATWPRAAFLGVGCALAISGKYLGAISLLVALPLLWKSGEHRARSFAVYFVFLFLCFFVVNFAIFTHLPTFTHSFARETALVVRGQAGMTRNVPHTQYWNVFLDNSTPITWVLLLVFLIARWRQRRTLTLIEIALGAFPFVFALALSFSPKSNDRYFLPATALFSLFAVIGASDLADWLAPRWPRRTVFAVAALVLVAAQFPSWTRSRPGWIGYNAAFQHDDTAELIQWLKTDVAADAVIAKDNRVALPDPTKKRDASRMGIIPQKILAHKSGFAADLGTLDELQARGVTHVAVSEMDYGKFFLRGLRPQKSGHGDFERRRDFYDQLIHEGELLWEREKSTVLYLHPGIRVYRLR